MSEIPYTAIINYGLGNPLSIKNMLRKLGADAVITSDANAISNAVNLILPGVGHFETGMQNLEESGLKSLLNDLVLTEKKPILGICLGMQLMTGHSEEGNRDGLNWIDAQTVKFQFDNPAVKVPHMGWTDTNFRGQVFNNSDFEETPPRFYYVHSYYVKCSDTKDVLAQAEYGGLVFDSGFVKNNIMGVQFHPEKSHVFGMAFLKKFLLWNP